MALDGFHPAVARWFAHRFGTPTEPQRRAWPQIRAGRHALIAAPTGSGKTLAAFLAALDALVRRGLESGLDDSTRVVYVSPLKALSNDIRSNLEEPLAGIREALRESGLPDVGIRTLVRTGDTPASQRAAMVRKPPHILVTTPESLHILLTSEGGRRMLAAVETLIVDEIHAVAGNKRGSHLALSMERLDALVRSREGGRLARVGLSATQRPIEEIARLLVGSAAVDSDGRPDCAIVDEGHRRELALTLELPGSPLEAVMSGEVWQELYDRLARRIEAHATTLVFVNTRRMVERVTRHLGERLGADRVGSHHGSLSREQRLLAERRLKAGELSALVATASLELGIDIGSVDLVCNIGSPRSIATLLQRVGRAGHRLSAVPRGVVFPTSRDELVECAALFDGVRQDELERLALPDRPLDILAQQLVAEVATREWGEDELYALVVRAWPYRDLTRDEFDEVVGLLVRGYGTRMGRRGAWLHHDAVNGRLRGRRGARLVAMTSGGAIPDTADYAVVLEPAGTLIGTLNEDFAIESSAGDIFQLGNSSWRIIRVEQGRVRVEDARGQIPTIPFWLGEAPARSPELSYAVSRVRATVERLGRLSPDEAQRWLADEVGVGAAAAEQIAEYLLAAGAALGTLPTTDTLVLERFFDEAQNQHLVLHAPFGARLNRAWGLALRKRFCRTFNFELQAAATDDAIVLSLGPTHSFPAEDVFSFLHSSTAREVLVQALLDAPMFTIRWRWNASRSLAVPRWRGGRRVPPRLLRMQAEDLIALVFPDQLACQENIAGEREIPDHPLVRQTLRDCLEEAMDADGFERLLGRIERGECATVVRELREPSPLALEVLNARPYAFLDDAPLEERRTQAVQARRWLDPKDAADLGRLDPAAIERVRADAWPQVTNADELHDALVGLGFLTAEEGAGAVLDWERFFVALVAAGRAATLRTASAGAGLWVAAERLPELRAIYPKGEICPPLAPPPRLAERAWGCEEALVELLRGRLECTGPVTVTTLARIFALDAGAIDVALACLEAEGFVMRGSFTPGAGVEWCERRLLARCQRATLDRLRREIEPVSRVDLMRFLADWQHVSDRLEGPEGVAAALEQLEGFEAPAAAWEEEILPARLGRYDPAWLDALCLAGRFVWCRAAPPASGAGPRAGPIRTTPITFLARDRLPAWCALPAWREAHASDLSSSACVVLERLAARGASFYADIVADTGLLRTQVESALAELVSRGLVTCDGFIGLRALLVPSSRRPGFGRRRRPGSAPGIEHAGRWAVLRREPRPEGEGTPEAGLAVVTAALLRRYGIVFRSLLARETLLPPWREVLRLLRRLEARGELRGGRFVDGFAGEQFALPESIARLRALRRRAPEGSDLTLGAGDPLNLLGILLPGERLAVQGDNRLLLRHGKPLAVRLSREVRFLDDLAEDRRWEAKKSLLGLRG